MAACVIGIPLALFALVLLLFLLFQVFDTWRKEGVLSACAITFTSLVLFPPLAVVETVEACLFPASMPERKDDADLQPLLEGGLQVDTRDTLSSSRPIEGVSCLTHKGPGAGVDGGDCVAPEVGASGQRAAVCSELPAPSTPLRRCIRTSSNSPPDKAGLGASG